MELKGRITKAELGKRNRKDDGSEYTAFELRIQIGTYERNVADYRTQTFNKTTEADELCKTYFHDDARAAAEMYHKGEVVLVKFPHCVNPYGGTETVVATVARMNDVKQAPAPAPAPAPQAPQPQGDDLPF